MKKLIAVIMSLSLIISPLVPTAQAADKPSGSAFYMNQILALGTATIGSSILMTCKLATTTPSLLAFMAGSVAFIGSEIAGGKAQQVFLKAKSEEIDQLEQQLKNGGGDLQKEILVMKLKEEKDKLGFVNKRKTWMMAVTTVYLAATALAVMEMICINAVPVAAFCQNWRMANCTPASTHGFLVKAIIAAYGSFAGSAGGGAISTYGGMGVALALTATSLSSTVATLYNTPEYRIGTFGVASALSIGVTAGLASTAKKLEDNVSKLEKLIAEFKEQTHEENGSVEGSETDYNEEEKKKYDLKALPKGKKIARQCWSSSGQGMQFGEESCKNSFKLTRPRFDASMNIPNLVAVTNTATDFGQAVSDGDSASADVLAGELANNAGRMTQIRDNLIKQMNEQRKAKGEKEYDLKDDVNKQITAMGNALNQQLANQGAGGLASAGTASLDAVDAEKTTDGTPAVINSASAEKAPEIPAANFNISEGVTNEDLFNSEANTTASLEDSLENYETTESDISKESEISIFKQLSNRYLLNYTKIFEKKKVVENAPSP